MKLQLKGHHFVTTDETDHKSQMVFGMLQGQKFQVSFEDVEKLLKQCITEQAGYFEGTMAKCK